MYILQWKRLVRANGRRTLREASNESERCVGNLAPAVVDRKGVASPGNFHDLGDAPVLLLLLERRVGDGPWHGVIHFAGNDEQRSAVRIRRVDLRLRPRVEVRGCRLKERGARRRHSEVAVELL